MALELEHRRNEVELLSRENEKYKELVANLDKQIETFRRLVEEYKAAADDRGKALEVKEEIDKLFRATIADQDKRIHRLEASNRFLKKLAGAAVLVAFALGIIVGSK